MLICTAHVKKKRFGYFAALGKVTPVAAATSWRQRQSRRGMSDKLTGRASEAVFCGGIAPLRYGGKPVAAATSLR
jgi:hypothetical protein